MNRAEFEPMDPRLEQAMTEIRNDSPDPAVVEAAADRVWARLVAAQKGEHIRGCADFQALIPDFRAGKLPEARATLVRDHLHECVACRRVYEGRLVTMPSLAAKPRWTPVYRWAAAAVVFLGVGGVVWFAYQQYGGGNGHTIVQAVNGTLYRVASDGNLQPIASGADLPDGVEIRTAKDSDAMVKLRDGSLVELRERTGLSTLATASDLTVRLGRGNIIVQAAKRRSGHLFVATADCRVAVTGTVFTVESGVKGSRVSVVEGEVHVSSDNKDHVLRPGDQMVTSPNIEARPVVDDVSWSRNRDKLVQQVAKLETRMTQVHFPEVRYSSRILDRLPASTVIFGSVPNLGQYLTETQGAFEDTIAQSPELRQWWSSKSAQIEQVLATMRAGSAYLGEELVMAVPSGENAPVFVAETKKDGFPEFLKKNVPGVVVETRQSLAVFGPQASSVQAVAAALDSPNPGFKGTPFHARIAEAYRGGAGMLFCADLAGMHNRPSGAENLRYFIAEQKEVRSQMQMRATLAFAGERTGIAGWLASPASMGALDYISPDATIVMGFVVSDPKAIVDQLSSLGERMIGQARAPENAAAIKQDLLSSLGGEFSISMDGPLVPVPSWKLITEVYDPARAESALERAVAAFNAEIAKRGGQPLRTGTEVVDGRTYYMVAGGQPNPLTEAHYTFANGYLIAAPSRALVTKALQTKTTGTSIAKSAKFLELEPRDQHASYSALVYENLGTTLAPIVGLLGSFAPPQARDNPRSQQALAALGDIKPMLIAAYAERDQITVAAGGNMLAKGMAGLLSGDISGLFAGAMPGGRQMQRVR